MPVPAKRDVTKDRNLSATALPICSVCSHPERSVLSPLVPCARCGKRWHRSCHKPAIAEHVAAATATAYERDIPTREPANFFDGTNGTGETDGELIGTPSSVSSVIILSSEAAPRGALAWHCASCTTGVTAAATERLAHRTHNQIRPDDTLYVPPPSLSKAHDVTRHTPLQRRRYLSGLPQRELAQWLAHALETHADLAVYPPKVLSPLPAPAVPARLPPLPGSGGRARLTAAEVAAAARNPSYRNKIISAIRELHALSIEKRKEQERGLERRAAEVASVVPAKRGRPPKRPVVAALQEKDSINVEVRRAVEPHHIPSFVPTPVDPEEEDPTGLMTTWPKPGRGLYMNIGADWDMNEDDESGDDTLSGAVLVDHNDHASFSSVVYNAVGQKVQENGLPVLRVM
ncbi:hypothetical protein SEPCBS57363_006516 [Sporothrix epigloea]|uniref:Uncharacterized protein n=1 Tax=Sporothrix epigloea TaxID=1892477 RepID=A0ABP0E7N4_9PEZI